ncbi:MAG TPA: alpha-galactosidase, partial [Sphingorhabdus sp.]|nr:alpha-galactosidase [Sphingorhabdus sp.]
STGRRQSMRFRSAVARAGHFGIELDLRKLEKKDRDRLAADIADYKATRDLIHAGRCWMGEGADGVSWCAFGNPSDLMVQVVRIAPPELRFPPSLRLQMLERGARYRVQIEGQPEMVAHGDWLKKSGLPLPKMNAENVHWIRVTKI